MRLDAEKRAKEEREAAQAKVKARERARAQAAADARAKEAARKAAQPGAVVSLCPACPAFDQFKTFEYRGREFKRLVNAF